MKTHLTHHELQSHCTAVGSPGAQAAADANPRAAKKTLEEGGKIHSYVTAVLTHSNTLNKLKHCTVDYQKLAFHIRQQQTSREVLQQPLLLVLPEENVSDIPKGQLMLSSINWTSISFYHPHCSNRCHPCKRSPEQAELGGRRSSSSHSSRLTPCPGPAACPFREGARNSPGCA